LKAPGTKLSKLKYEKLLLSFALDFNLRRYILVPIEEAVHQRLEAGT